MHTSLFGSWALLVQMITTATARIASGGVTYVADGLKHAGDLLAMWHDRAQQRQTLATLDERMLSDCAINPATADTESRRPFWRYY